MPKGAKVHYCTKYNGSKSRPGFTGQNTLHWAYNISFCFSFVDIVLVYMSANVFVCLYIDVLAVYLVSLSIRHNSWYAVSSTHKVLPKLTLGPPAL